MLQNLSSYYVFYTVAKKGNISQASKELFISQPAVSKTVSKLEASLGAKLLTRNSKGVSLTPEGKKLYHHLQEAFYSIELGEEQLLYDTAQKEKHITIGVSTTLCKYTLLPFLEEYIRNHPHVKLSISCQSSYETINELQEGNIDIGLIGEAPIPKDWFFQKTHTIEDVFVANQQYLERLTAPDAEATLLLMDSENLSREYVDRYILQNKIHAGNIIEVSTMDLLIEFAKIGLGIACVIKEFIEEELESGTLKRLPLEENIPPRNIGFIYRNQKATDPTFLDFIHSYNQYRPENKSYKSEDE